MKILESLIKKLLSLKFNFSLNLIYFFRFTLSSIITVNMVMMLSGCLANNTPNYTTQTSSEIIRSISPTTKLVIKTLTPIKNIEENIRTYVPQTPKREITSNGISSPLKGIPLDELTTIISNPFQFPSTGKDDGHPGLDFAFYTFHEWNSIDNLDVVSILPGLISGVIYNRPPYGNAILIETPWQDLNIEQQRLVMALYPDEPLQTKIILNCPETFNINSDFSKESLSLYVLYGHLKNFQDFELGDSIEPGSMIGKVGNTGMSGNPHLHLEIRVGPKSSVFLKMAHYDNSITKEEMENYCLWRVSGYFFPIDPGLILGFEPTKP